MHFARQKGKKVITKALADMVVAANRMPRAANKTSKHVGDMETLVLPERKESNNNE